MSKTEKEKEYESKALIDKEKHLAIKTFLENKTYLFDEERQKYDFKKIEDIYLDTIDEYFKVKKSALRIRKIDNNIVLNLKVKNSEETDEYFYELEKQEFDKIIVSQKIPKIIGENFETPFNISDLLLVRVAKIKHTRDSYYFNSFKIDLDENKFSRQIDYEVEIESSSKLKSRKILEKLAKEIDFKISTELSKIARYYLYKVQDEKTQNSNQNNSVEKYDLNIENSIIVVEGKSDENRIKLIFPKANIFKTNGLGITEEKMNLLKKIVKKNSLNVIVCTDPDKPGEYIRNLIDENFSKVYHIHVEKKKSFSKNKNKIGIEHCDIDYLKKCFKNIHLKNKETKSLDNYTMEEMIDWGIYNNKKNRTYFTEYLGIAYGNNKKILKQLNNYNIKRDKIRDALNIIDKDEYNGN